MSDYPKLSRWWRKYRVVVDCYAGYEAQVRYCWWPFWLQLDGCNTHNTFREAYNHCLYHSKINAAAL